MTGVYEQAYRIRSCNVDRERRLRLSTLFTMLQEASIAHTTLLGMGREKTLDQGLLWIVTLQEAHIARLPVYDEEIVLYSHPGDTMHLFFPRYYRITDREGHVLVDASALWALMDTQTRRMAFPEEHGIVINGVKTGEEIPLPRPPRLGELTEKTAFTVLYSYADLNGHMNNTRYLDLAEDIMPPEVRSGKIRLVQTEFSAEARPGDSIALSWGAAEGVFSLSGEREKRLFRLKLEYER